MASTDKPDVEIAEVNVQVTVGPAGPPVIDQFPALYEFRVIARNSLEVRDRIPEIVQAVVGLIPDDALTEKPSSGGKYRAIHVSCMLTSEEQRRDVYARLHADKAVVFLL